MARGSKTERRENQLEVTIHGLADKEKTSQILTVGFCMVNRRCLRI